MDVDADDELEVVLTRVADVPLAEVDVGDRVGDLEDVDVVRQLIKV